MTSMIPKTMSSLLFIACCISSNALEIAPLLSRALPLSEKQAQAHLEAFRGAGADDDFGTYLVCVPINHNRKLSQECSASTFTTLYNSKATGMSCLLASRTSKKSLKQLCQNVDFRVVTPLPRESKLSRAFFRPSNDGRDEKEPAFSVLHDRFAEPGDIESLIVSIAQGVPSPLDSKHGIEWIQDIQAKAAKSSLGGPPSEDTQEPFCDFSGLRLSSRKGRNLSRQRREEKLLLKGIETLRVENRLFEKCFLSLLESLAGHPDIIHVEPRHMHAEIRNSRITRILQTDANANNVESNLQPIWNLGIDGTGQIVAAADTGLDMRSCFFSDSDGAPLMPTSSITNPTFDLSQTKVVQYIAFQDNKDELHGHGTHVVGTMAGNIGSGWASNADEITVDSCTSTTDSISQCSLTDYYSNCAELTDYCVGSDSDIQSRCIDSCQCAWKLNGEPIKDSGGYDAASLIADSKGVAFNARVSFMDLGDSDGALWLPTDLETGLFQPAYDAGARIHSNSWGLAEVYEVTSYDKDVDEFVYNNPEFLVLFAAGNDADVSTIGSPSQSKNSLTVGSSMTGRWVQDPSGKSNTSYVSYFSSNGPAADGRIKPEVVAPGNVAVSASSIGYNTNSYSCAVNAQSGTSMATPATAGAAALVRQYLSGSGPNGSLAASSVLAEHVRAVSADLRWSCLPGYPCNGINLVGTGGALVKAMLIHGTTNMAAWDRMNLEDGSSLFTQLGQAPDMSQGFGRVTLDTVLLPAATSPGSGGQGLWASADEVVTSGNSVEYSFHIISSAFPLKVTVVWYDPPTSVAASQQLVHDLDVKITDESLGITYYANGGSEGNLDELNPVEKVIVSTPQTTNGTYTVEVSASTLSESDSQNFAIVISGAGYYIDGSTSWELLNTPPTPQPTISHRPSISPSLSPTPLPTQSIHPSLAPSKTPTIAPSIEATRTPPSGSSNSDHKETIFIAAAICSVAGFLLIIGSIALCISRSSARRQQHKANVFNEQDAIGDNVKVMIKVPEGVAPGDTIQAAHPDYPSGVNVVVPPGIRPGHFIEVKPEAANNSVAIEMT